jgi:hypothetical protein
MNNVIVAHVQTSEVIGEISDSHGGKYEGDRFPGCAT